MEKKFEAFFVAGLYTLAFLALYNLALKRFTPLPIRNAIGLG